MAHKKKKQVEKPKEVEEELVKETISMKTGKGVLKRIKKSETTKPTQEPLVETAEPIAKTIPMENPVSSKDINTQEGEITAKKSCFKRVKKLQITRRGVVLCEFSSPGSPALTKHQALDVAHKLKNRKHNQEEVQFEKVIMETENDSDGSDT